MAMMQRDNQVSKKEGYMTLLMCYKGSGMLKKYIKISLDGLEESKIQKSVAKLTIQTLKLIYFSENSMN